MGRQFANNHALQTLSSLMFFPLIVIIIFFFSIKPALSQNTPAIAKPTCAAACGGVSIPYPFGTTENCCQHSSFLVTCNETLNPPQLSLALANGTLEILDINIDGQVRVMTFIGKDCYTRRGGSTVSRNATLTLANFLTVNNTANKITAVGCDSFGEVYGMRINREFYGGCSAYCYAKDDLLEQGSCTGLGCCQISIPKDVTQLDIVLQSYANYSEVWDFNDCGYAFVAEETVFNFSYQNLINLRNVSKLPLIVDWAIGNGTCEEAKMNSTSYACVSSNSICYEPENGYGYRCRCPEGYRGNPYIVDDCHDVNECEDVDLSKCEHGCINTEGGFFCTCPKGYGGDGRIGGEGCRRGESPMLKIFAGSAVGVIILLLAACVLYLELKRRRTNRTKQKYFLHNGGLMLLEKLAGRERSADMVKIFSSTDLQKATNDFSNDMIIGQGGFGTVYKGLLSDNTTVAIKRSKRVDPNQTEQFINEVLVLSQVNHRNVVRLLGCCFETEVPLLVYEFVDNGTLSSHVHNRSKGRYLDWDTRLRIAAETAGVLSYLHSSAAIAIIHRDVKSDNILLDRTFTAKVADFGASRLVPIDQTQLSTMVQGTFGYLDPEYMQTNQLTEKSDVYSFGVVLLELISGRGAISFNKPEEEKNLSFFFLSMLKQDRVHEIVDDSIVGVNYEQVMDVAKVAKGCLHVKGEDRPSMKQVAMELEGLRVEGKHAWGPSNEEGTEFMLGERSINNGFVNGDGRSASVGYDSICNHVDLPSLGGGR